MEAEEFFRSDINTVCKFLSRDELKISTEVDVLRLILGWISSNGEKRYDKIDEIMRCVRFHNMTQKELMECDNRVKAIGDIVLLYTYRSIVPRHMAEQLQNGINVSSTEPRTVRTGQSDLEPLLDYISSRQEDANSDDSEFEDVSDIDEAAQVQSKEKKDLLKESMQILLEKMDVLNARVWDDYEDMTVDEYKELAKKREDLTTDVGSEPKNKGKNRYVDILPYDYNRVKLRNCRADYINASYIQMGIKGRKEEVKRYIATQGPLPNTSNYFWSMVWQEKVQRIVMLTPEIECDLVKCHRYWPGYKETITYGKSFQVTCTKEVDLSSSVVERKFKVKHLKTNEERSITQNQYDAWPELGGPDDTSDFMHFLSKIRSETKGSKKPTIVHCSAGVGRTGVFITLDTALSLMEAKQPVHPIEIIKELRDQRPSSIQTSRQYEFICNAILKVYKEKFDKPQKMQAVKRPSAWKRGLNRLKKAFCCCVGGGKEEMQTTTQ